MHKNEVAHNGISRMVSSRRNIKDIPHEYRTMKLIDSVNI